MSRAPVLFVSHGAPTFATEPGVLGPQLRRLGRQLAALRAVLVVSPHWQTRGLRVMATPRPETIHDFGGFPAELYRLHYPAPGSPALASEAVKLLAAADFDPQLDDARGLDHGAWVPLLHLLPAANVPVFQVSLPVDLDTADALRLGRTLAPLRERGVLIVGSGNMTHNLHEVRFSPTGEAAHAREFTAWVRQAVRDNAVDRLIAYRRNAPHATRSHPTEEHFLPLLVALGANSEAAPAHVVEGGITYGVLSMESYAWGIDATLP